MNIHFEKLSDKISIIRLYAKGSFKDRSKWSFVCTSVEHSPTVILLKAASGSLNRESCDLVKDTLHTKGYKYAAIERRGVWKQIKLF